MNPGEHEAGSRLHSGLIVVYLITVTGLTTVHLHQTLTAARFQFAALVPPALYGLALGGAVWWGHRHAVTERDVAVVSGWGIAGHTALVVAVGLFILGQQQLGGQIISPVLTLTSFGFVGGLYGVLIGVEHVDRRVTARREQEARDMLEGQSEVVSVLNRVLRHNVRNEANVIFGYAELLQVSPDQQRQVDAIQRAAQEMISKGELARSIERLCPGLAESPTSLDLSATVTEVAAAVERDYPAVDLTVTARQDAYGLVHPMFAEAVRQLVENAVEHNDTPVPVVSVHVDPVDHGDQSSVTVSVEDDGPGIPPLERATLRRGTETPLEHSQGLGLWFAARVTTLSDGDIAITDREPRGTRIEVTVPAAAPPSPNPGSNPDGAALRTPYGADRRAVTNGSGRAVDIREVDRP